MRFLVLLLMFGMAGCSTEARVDRCEPDFGTTAGGDDIKVVGQGFSTGLSVTVGNKSAQIVSVTDSRIEIKTPPAYHLGPVDVLVVNADGKTLMRRSCFRYVEQQSGQQD